MLMGKPTYSRKCEKKDGSCWVPRMFTNPVFRQSSGISELPVMECSRRGARTWWFLLGYSVQCCGKLPVGPTCAKSSGSWIQNHPWTKRLKPTE